MPQENVELVRETWDAWQPFEDGVDDVLAVPDGRVVVLYDDRSKALEAAGLGN